MSIRDTSVLNVQVGMQGEKFVNDYLARYGYYILASNYRTRRGEVDIIATKDNIINFVEVKTRSHNRFCLSEVITRSKQKKIVLAAQQFLQEQSIESYQSVIRFDVALLHLNDGKFILTFIENAFTCEAA